MKWRPQSILYDDLQKQDFRDFRARSSQDLVVRGRNHMQERTADHGTNNSTDFLYFMSTWLIRQVFCWVVCVALKWGEFLFGLDWSTSGNSYDDLKFQKYDISIALRNEKSVRNIIGLGFEVAVCSFGLSAVWIFDCQICFCRADSKCRRKSFAKTPNVVGDL